MPQRVKLPSGLIALAPDGATQQDVLELAQRAGLSETQIFGGDTPTVSSREFAQGSDLGQGQSTLGFGSEEFQQLEGPSFADRFVATIQDASPGAVRRFGKLLQNTLEKGVKLSPVAQASLDEETLGRLERGELKIPTIDTVVEALDLGIKEIGADKIAELGGRNQLENFALGIAAFAPDLIINLPISGGTVVSSLTKGALAKITAKFGPETAKILNNSIAKFVGRTGQRGVGGAAGGTQFAVATDEDVVESAVGFAVAEMTLGALGDGLKGFAKVTKKTSTALRARRGLRAVEDGDINTAKTDLQEISTTETPEAKEAVKNLLAKRDTEAKKVADKQVDETVKEFGIEFPTQEGKAVESAKAIEIGIEIKEEVGKRRIKSRTEKLRGLKELEKPLVEAETQVAQALKRKEQFEAIVAEEEAAFREAPQTAEKTRQAGDPESRINQIGRERRRFESEIQEARDNLLDVAKELDAPSQAELVRRTEDAEAQRQIEAIRRTEEDIAASAERAGEFRPRPIPEPTIESRPGTGIRTAEIRRAREIEDAATARGFKKIQDLEAAIERGEIDAQELQPLKERAVISETAGRLGGRFVGKSEPTRLAESVGKPEQVETLKRMGVKEEAQQTQMVIEDAIRNPLITGDVDTALKNGRKLKAAGGPRVSKAISQVIEKMEAAQADIPKERARLKELRETETMVERRARIEKAAKDSVKLEEMAVQLEMEARNAQKRALQLAKEEAANQSKLEKVDQDKMQGEGVSAAEVERARIQAEKDFKEEFGEAGRVSDLVSENEYQQSLGVLKNVTKNLLKDETGAVDLGKVDGTVINAIAKIASHDIEGFFKKTGDKLKFAEWRESMVKVHGSEVGKYLEPAWAISAPKVEARQARLKALEGRTDLMVKQWSKPGNYRVNPKTKPQATQVREIVGPDGVVVATINGTMKDAQALSARIKRQNRNTSIGVNAAELSELARIKEDIQAAGFGAKLVNPPRIFEELDARNPGVNTINLWHEAVAAEAAIARQFNTYRERIKAASKGVDVVRVSTANLLAEGQVGGQKVVDFMKLKPVKLSELTVKETKLSDTVKNAYNELYSQLNETRRLIGKDPIPYIENYMTFRRVLDTANERGVSLTLDPAESVAKVIDSVSFKNLSRKNLKKAIDLDYPKVGLQYIKGALRHIHMSPVVAKSAEFITPFAKKFGANEGLVKEITGTKSYSLQDTAPEFVNFLHRWSHDIAGVKTGEGSFFGPVGDRIANIMSRNLAYSILSGTVRSALIQPSAIRNAVPLIGVQPLGRGVQRLFSKQWRDFARKNSDHLQGRVFDATIEETLDASIALSTISVRASAQQMFNSLVKGRNIVGDFGFKLLKGLDQMTATAVWLGAHDKAIRDGLKGKEANQFANLITVKTQGDASVISKAPIQNTPIGRALTLFQTFAINEWGLLVRDIMGVKNPKVNPREAARRLTAYILSGAVAASFYEDVLHLTSPIPTPIRAAIQELDEGGTPIGALKESALEVVELVPLVGGSVRFGSDVGGPAVELVNDIIDVIAEEKGPRKSKLELAGKAIGFPGTSQIKKMKRAIDAGSPIHEVILGVYPEHRAIMLEILTGVSHSEEFKLD